MSNSRYANPAADALIDVKHPVLNHGFVALRDYMGGDRSIADAARISYQDGTKTVNDDAGLIDHLIRNAHTSPIEQVVMTFHLKLPIFVMRQLVRHRTARLNEMSGRYSVMPDEFYVPTADVLQPQSKGNKQGREEGELGLSREKIITTMEGDGDSTFDLYHTLLDAGLSRELARINLPLSTYTEVIWQIDLHNLMHFLKLRLDHHAQYEIRVFAQEIYKIAKVIAPLAMASFDNWKKDAVTFSGVEFKALGALLEHLGGAEVIGMLGYEGDKRAFDRFIHKLKTGIQQ